MSNFIDLESLLVHGNNSNRPAVQMLRTDGLKSQQSGAELFDHAERWRQVFARQAGSSVALYFARADHFAAALIGAWRAGKKVFLAADNLPATQQSLQQSVTLFAGEWPLTIDTLLADSKHDASSFIEADLLSAALVVFTSGSSGQPIPIYKSLAQISVEIKELERCWGGAIGDAVIYASVSHQHLYGLLFAVLWPLCAGRVFAEKRLDYPEQILSALSSSASVLIASPAHLKRLPEHIDWTACRDHLRHVFSSGGPLELPAVMLCERLWRQAPVEVYGSSETGGIAWRQRHDGIDCPWIAFSGVDIVIDGGTGLLSVHSPYLPDASYFQMADRAEWQGKGFQLLGRGDRIVKIEEKRISLTAIEQALMKSELLDSAQVVVLPGPRQLLGVVAVPNEQGRKLLLEAGKRAMNTNLGALLMSSVEACALPRRWRYVGQLPTNTQSKVTQKLLLEFFDRHRPDAALIHYEAEQAVLSFQLEPDFPGFSENSVLPEDAQIALIQRFAKELFPLGTSKLSVDELLFQLPIRPQQSLLLEFELHASKNHLGFVLSTDGATTVSGGFFFGPPI